MVSSAYWHCGGNFRGRFGVLRAGCVCGLTIAIGVNVIKHLYCDPINQVLLAQCMLEIFDSRVHQTRYQRRN